MSNHIISKILDRPDAYLIIEAVKAALDKEKDIRLKFYNKINEEEKAEFINGEVVKHLSATMRNNLVSGLLVRLLNFYVDKKNLGAVGFEQLMISLTRNDYEPDICFYKSNKAILFTDDQMHFPAPDLVIEVVSPLTEARDRGVKFTDYQAHGIEEFWIVDSEKNNVEQYHLEDEKYFLVLKSSSGFIRSFVVEDFQIPIPAIFDSTENQKALRNLF